MLACWRTKPKNRPTFTLLREELDKLISGAAENNYLELDDVSVGMPSDHEGDPGTSSAGNTLGPLQMKFVNDSEPRILCDYLNQTRDGVEDCPEACDE